MSQFSSRKDVRVCVSLNKSHIHNIHELRIWVIFGKTYVIITHWTSISCDLRNAWYGGREKVQGGQSGSALRLGHGGSAATTMTLRPAVPHQIRVNRRVCCKKHVILCNSQQSYWPWLSYWLGNYVIM
ncbi:hypothetical protein CDAR_55021 [Caerostris darwini]|uniref:Uncharacterized protein n=1 Tax=Caerostris darwini TaxID=1538125 RepID=A0AAV4PD58_9ARAC|nr:hypothetical protein CDAR_55021 [Caerostris darwini]